MRKVRENILVTSGNQPLFAANQAVFGEDGVLLVAQDQMVIWSPSNNRSLGPGTTVSSNDRIIMSVAHGETLRSNFGDVLYGNNIQAATAQAAKCGLSETWDLFFDCIGAGENFSVDVKVTDNETENQYPYNRPATYTYSANTGSYECATCDSGYDCIGLACAIRDQINGDSWNNKDAGQKSVYNNLKLGKNVPFAAHVLFGGDNLGALTTHVFCINPTSGACENCITAGVTIGNITAGGVVYPLSLPVDTVSGETFLAGLKTLEAKLNKVLGSDGSAIITKGAGIRGQDQVTGAGICCPYKLEVNTCHADFAIAGLATCENYNPFDAVEVEQACTNCAAIPTKQYTCGIRIIAKPVEYDCNCYPPNPPKGSLYRKLEVYPTKGFTGGSWFVRQTQKTELPQNLGYEWQWREYASANGGRGRGHDPFNSGGYGPIGLPLDRGRSGSTKVSCEESYCSYAIEHSLPNRDTGVHGTVTAARGRTVILIPVGDTVTITEFEAVWNEYLLSGNSGAFEVTCNTAYPQLDAAGVQLVDGDAVALPNTIDQGLIEGQYTEGVWGSEGGRVIVRYPDANGRIVH